MLDIRKRTGWLFFCVMLAQVILVSAQVQSKSGVRVLELVTFELFSRVERATSSAVRGVRDVWGNYASLRGARDENEVLRRQLSELRDQAARGACARGALPKAAGADGSPDRGRVCRPWQRKSSAGIRTLV